MPMIKMHISRKTLPSMMSENDYFVSTYARYVEETLMQANLFPCLSMTRLVKVQEAWINELRRAVERDPNLTGGLDHFQQVSYLVFWLRVLKPVKAVETNDNFKLTHEETSDDTHALRSIIKPYANEYLAFCFGFQICKYYEINKSNPNFDAVDVFPSQDYFRTAARYICYRSVSPHALTLVFKSLFA